MSSRLLLSLAAPLAVFGPLRVPDDPADTEPALYREVDYGQLDRELLAEPRYLAAPRYALFLFGPTGSTRMWAALDKSDAALRYYDVLYCDKDFDGDLTDEGERFTSEWDDDRSRVGRGIDLRVGDLHVPGTDLVHTGFRVSTVFKGGVRKSDGSAWFQLTWNGEQEISGGYAPARKQMTRWGASPATAPVFRPTPRGPFHFALYTWGKDGWSLPIGGASKLYVMVGNRGSGPDTLAIVDEDFLDLERDELIVTVIARDATGKPLHTRSRLDQHC